MLAAVKLSRLPNTTSTLGNLARLAIAGIDDPLPATTRPQRVRVPAVRKDRGPTDDTCSLGNADPIHLRPGHLRALPPAQFPLNLAVRHRLCPLRVQVIAPIQCVMDEPTLGAGGSPPLRIRALVMAMRADN